MNKQINKTQLLNFLNGNCNEEEAVVINQFLKTSAGQNLLNDLLNEHWAFAEDSKVDQFKLVEWKKEWSLKYKEDSIEAPVKSKRISLIQFFRYAAVFTALVLGIGIYTVVNKKKESVLVESSLLVQKNPLGSRSHFILNDGTHIYLGPGSSLSYPAKFSGSKREVILKGEAYFEVAKNKEKPFIIYTENLRTQVLGTTFKVTSFKDNPIMVSVTTGRVRVDKIDGNNIQELAILHPGEQVSYNKKSEVQKSNFDVESIKNWKKGQLVFNGTPLAELTNQISRWYNISISINTAALKQIPITVTLDGNMPVNKFLDGLSISFGFHYSMKNRSVTIY